MKKEVQAETKAEDFYTFNTQQEMELFDKIIREIRCTVCHNQSLAESSALFAIDLRNAIYLQVRSGQQEANIRQFISERYGDYASYRPPFEAETALLWFGPVLMLFAAFLFLRKSKNKAA